MKAIIGDFTTDIFPTDEEIKSVCKVGQGADCCVWITLGGNGFECKYLNKPFALLDRFKAGETAAKRDGCDRVKNFSTFGHATDEVEVP